MLISNMESFIDHLTRVFKLKDEKRRGWVLREVDDPESVADHSWGTAYLCLLFAEAEQVDREKALSIAVVHDAAESVTGDIATRVHSDEQAITKKEKKRSEYKAMNEICGPLGDAAEAPVTGLPLSRIYALWNEYEEADTVEARFVRDMNLIDMCLQALIYQKERRYTHTSENPNFRHFSHLDEFFATAGPRFSTETGKTLFQAIKERYERLK